MALRQARVVAVPSKTVANTSIPSVEQQLSDVG